MPTLKYIHDFGSTSANKQLLGNKGAGLAEMSNLSLNVPPGFTITTDLCKAYHASNGKFPAAFEEELDEAIARLETKTNKIFGSSDGAIPLLLSIRSGAVASMPGMMDTILNLGINKDVAGHLGRLTNNPKFADDTLHRFTESYNKLVGHDGSNLKAQLIFAIKAVIDSWMSPRAVAYRKIHHISDEHGTAVNIQAMVFGNMGDTSGTGVLFTRNPSSGKKALYGEFLLNAQGEDVVSGIRTPMPISPTKKHPGGSLYETMPDIYHELEKICALLENHYADMQDIEFTIENGTLYILQTRSGKRTARASITIAVDMVTEGKITKEEAISRVDAESLNQMLHAMIDPNYIAEPLSQGLPASPGAASGIVVFSPYDAEELALHHKVILVRNDTSPEDITGMHVSAGILTARGGMTSHAAVVARGMGKPCVCGASEIKIDEIAGLLHIGQTTIKKGETITIDGDSGKIFQGQVPTITPDFSENFNILMSWADEIRTMEVRANAETVSDVNTALRLGAQGVGLCRTEHMFFEVNKIALMREMIVAPNETLRQNALDKLLPLHKEDFKDIFKNIAGMPINIRLIDPPLHEFLPQGEKEKQALAVALKLPIEVINQRLHALHEVNPMLGHRGCRLGITYPHIYAMQVEAIVTAAIELKHETNLDTDIEIMIPLIAHELELANLRTLAINVITTIEEKLGAKVNYKIGTMIELPRAALRANKIAPFADYFSFGTNDLTQTTYGISRDDVASFIPQYLAQKILPNDPFTKIDQDGVGELIQIAIKRGRKIKPDLKIGICGEHGGDPSSIEFFYKLGMNYISCSPYRVPIARLSAAQAVIKDHQNIKQ